ncbi:E3 ubiquitin-protein ligase hrd1 [Mortierella sp. AM989]|nr:E3 ubiquitin-protein ligase hrd1 [Mortierella sp. AM989]
MARLAVYGAVSAALAGGVIASAFAQRSNFYAACIYLSRSNACMMIILNLGLFLTIITGQLVQMIFFGNLRTLEVEHLYERAWYAVTETCLAMTIFKDEFDTRFVVMFTVLLFLKVFHWLCMDRVDSMEQSPEIPLPFHVRMVTMIAMLVSLDVLLVFHAVNMVTLRGPNMMIMFGFEYTLLATSLMASFGKYVLHTIDMRSEEPWENKSMLLFYLDLVADFVKLVTYLLFFMVILVCYGLPLHIIRDVYMTMRSFLQKCKDLIQYRKATRNMNERYPDASPAELAALSDPICIICREEMVGNQPDAAAPGAVPAPIAQHAPPRSSGSNTNVPKKLPCGHIFHFHCLKSWLERQQSCPTCRRLVLDPPTPASTPVPAAAGDAGAGAGAAGVPGAGGNQQGVAPAVPGNFGNNNVQQAPGGHGVNPAFLPNHGMGGYHLLAPQGHYPLAGWHPQMMPGLPHGGAGNGTGTSTPASAGTGANTGGMGAPGAAPIAGQANYIPHYLIPNVMHPIPGFIPLFPLGGDAAGAGHHQNPNVWAAQTPSDTSNSNSPQQQGSGYGGANERQHAATSSAAPSVSSSSKKSSIVTDQIPLTPLDTLSNEQLQYLEENTRRGLQERIRVLQAVESQIAQSVIVLNRVLGVLPPEGTPFRSETADPPSPTMPPSGETSSSSSTSAMNRMFGTSASQVGLQSLSRSGLEHSLSNGRAQPSDAATTTASSPNSSQQPNIISLPTPTLPVQPTAISAVRPEPRTEIVEVIPASTADILSQGSLNNDRFESDGLLPTTINGSSDHTEQMEDGRVNKGKGKKTDSEIESESAVVSTDQNEINGDKSDTDDDDSKYSPQEMVRRRWAKLNSSPLSD